MNAVYQSRCAGRSGPVAWPSRSQDFTPLDFLWDCMQSKVYHTDKTETRQQLKGLGFSRRWRFKSKSGLWRRVVFQVEVLWVVTLCNVVGNQRLRGPCCLHVQGILPQHYTASQPKRRRLETSPP